MNIIGFSPFGYEGSLVTVEVDLRRGIPATDMVGLADNAVREARERMRAAIRNSGFEYPPERILISLSPADVKKEGAVFDLAIALAVLNKGKSAAASVKKTADVLVMGELELSGRIRPVRGIHAALSTARERGIRYCIIPAENKAEAAFFSSAGRTKRTGKSGAPMKVFAASHLTGAFALLSELEQQPLQNISASVSCGGLKTEPGCAQTPRIQDENIVFSDFPAALDYREIKGQAFFIRALQTAAAGRHNLIVYGAPGCGKTLALSRFYTLLPRLSEEEALPVTRIYSIAGMLPTGTKILTDAPFRRPHQSASLEGIIGGGVHCRPGEISLAHNGVLFLDEAADFRASVLQALRVPLEEGKITLSRAGRTTEYPARFQLLLAANPCPCGNFGSPDKICLCHPRAVEQYWRRFSAPLLDRIDIRVALSSGAAQTQTAPHSPENGRAAAQHSTEQLRRAIAAATNRQRRRQGKPNSRLDACEIRRFCPLDAQTEDFLTDQSRRFGFSERGIHSCIKLARTIADMAERDRIEKGDAEEAVLLHRNAGGIHLMF